MSLLQAIGRPFQSGWDLIKKVGGALVSPKTLLRSNLVDLHRAPNLGEKCGVFGMISSNGESVLEYFPLALAKLQHRGQQAAGLALTTATGIEAVQTLGSVEELITQSKKLMESNQKAHMVIGHTLYATSKTKDGSQIHPQPYVVEHATKPLALIHNGNIPDLTTIKQFLHDKGLANEKIKGLNDSSMIAEAIAVLYQKENKSIEEAIEEVAKLISGGYSLIIMTKDKLTAVRDPHGLRPLVMGYTKQGNFVFTSETAALKPIQAERITDVDAGKMVSIDKNGHKTWHTYNTNAKTKIDAFEFVYFSRPDSVLEGISVHQARRRAGIQLAKEFRQNNPNTQIDYVVPVPDSGIAAACGFAEELGVPVNMVLIKNRHGRTFIEGGNGVENKFATVDEELKGKNVLLVDDSIVRGKTSKALIKFVKQAKPATIHMAIASPPVAYPDFYGVDTPDQQELIFAKLHKDDQKQTTQAIARDLDLNSLTYLSVPGLVESIGLPRERLNLSCFTGEYPAHIGDTQAAKVVGYKLAA